MFTNDVWKTLTHTLTPRLLFHTYMLNGPIKNTHTHIHIDIYGNPSATLKLKNFKAKQKQKEPTTTTPSLNCKQRRVKRYDSTDHLKGIRGNCPLSRRVKYGDTACKQLTSK